MWAALSLAAAASLPAAGAASPEKEYQVQAIFEQMEADVLAFRDEMERVYAARCDTATLTECARGNYNDCSSTYPNQVCMEADELVLPTCGDGVDCNGEQIYTCTKFYVLRLSTLTTSAGCDLQGSGTKRRRP